MDLVWPAAEYLSSYVAALERGWSPDNVRAGQAVQDELEQIARDPAAFLTSLVDREAKRRADSLARRLDGSAVARLCALDAGRRILRQIGFRWQPGTEALRMAACSSKSSYHRLPLVRASS